MQSGSFLAAQTSSPVKVIFDTDMSGDCDDVGALAILNQFADAGEAEILACVVNGHDQQKAAAAAVNAINTYYGRPNIPGGTYQGTGYPATKSPYTAQIRDEFPHSALPDDQAPRALDIYRKALASAPDASVTIVSVGFLVNLKDLLQSPPDALSPVSGTDLVKQKVRQMVVMGGQFPKSSPGHGEYNFAARGSGTDTQFVMENWPTPILLTGFEIGGTIHTGANLAASPAASPVRRAYELYTALKDRPSWDLTAVLAAVCDPGRYWTIIPDGYCKVGADGSDEWFPKPNRGHSYLVAKVSPAEIATLLDDLMDQPPRTASKHDGSVK